MCRWSPALLKTIRAGSSPTPRGIETAADCPRRQHRREPHDRRPVSQALLGRYHHMEAVGLVDVIDQGGAIRAELCPMAGHGGYIRRLGRRHTGNGERGGGKEGSHLILHRQRSRVPTARGQSAEDRVARGLLVEMKRLWIEFGGECLDPLPVSPQPSGTEGLACGESLRDIAWSLLPSGVRRSFVAAGAGHRACQRAAHPVAALRIDAAVRLRR